MAMVVIMSGRVERVRSIALPRWTGTSTCLCSGSRVGQREQDALQVFSPVARGDPRRYWAGGRLAKLLLSLLLAPQEERETIRECVQYISANGMFPWLRRE